MILITGYFVAISVGWNLPAQHRYVVGIATTLLIASVILLNVARWIVFVIKYARLNIKRLSNRRKGKKDASIGKAMK